MAAGDKQERGILGRLLHLTLLAPDIVEAIVEGRQAQGVTLLRLMEQFPAARARQDRVAAGTYAQRQADTEVIRIWRSCPVSLPALCLPALSTRSSRGPRAIIAAR